MGFFDRLSGKKTPPSTTAVPTEPAPAAASVERQAAANVVTRVAAAREKLDAKDLPAALAIYEELLAVAGDRADVLVAISGDLGARGHVGEIIELVAPRYDAERHGPATGLNLLQAYLVTRNADAAQHVLDILFALNRSELDARLHGFSNAIAELIHERHAPLDPGAVGQVAAVAKVGLITISKPIWFYGLEPLAAQILPPKEGRLRRIAFAQLAVPGAYENIGEAMEKPEDELGALSRALPAWLAETFYFSPAYAPVAAVAIMNRPGRSTVPMIFGTEWTEENLRQLVDTTDGGLDYIFTGAVRAVEGGHEVMLRVWEVKKFRERKTFSAKWTAATADAELAKLHEQVRAFMECTPGGGGLAYAAPTHPRAWLDTLAVSLRTFLIEKNVLPAEQLGVSADALAALGQHAASGEVASLAWLTLRARVAKHGVAAPAAPALFESPIVAQASSLPS